MANTSGTTAQGSIKQIISVSKDTLLTDAEAVGIPVNSADGRELLKPELQAALCLYSVSVKPEQSLWHDLLPTITTLMSYSKTQLLAYAVDLGLGQQSGEKAAILAKIIEHLKVDPGERQEGVCAALTSDHTEYTPPNPRIRPSAPSSRSQASVKSIPSDHAESAPSHPRIRPSTPSSRSQASAKSTPRQVSTDKPSRLSPRQVRPFSPSKRHWGPTLNTDQQPSPANTPVPIPKAPSFKTLSTSRRTRVYKGPKKRDDSRTEMDMDGSMDEEMDMGQIHRVTNAIQEIFDVFPEYFPTRKMPSRDGVALSRLTSGFTDLETRLHTARTLHREHLDEAYGLHQSSVSQANTAFQESLDEALEDFRKLLL